MPALLYPPLEAYYRVTSEHILNHWTEPMLVARLYAKEHEEDQRARLGAIRTAEAVAMLFSKGPDSPASD